MHAFLRTTVSCLILSLAPAGCDSTQTGAPAGRSENQAPPAQEGASLYDRLGGERTIRTIVDDFVDKAVADPRVNFTRRGTAREWQATAGGIEHFKKHLTNLICERAGGPQRYRGKDMKRVHRGMRISGGEFDAFAAHLASALVELKIPSREQGELTAIVESTRSDIVESQN